MKQWVFAFCFGIASLQTVSAQEYPALTTVFEDSTYQLTGVAVSKSGRLFTNYPRWAPPYKYALVEVTGAHSSKPFPDANWNAWDGTGNKMQHFLCVQAVVIDNKDNMWVVDAGSTKPSVDNDKGQKLVKINLKNNQVERVYPLASATDGNSYMNDTRIDTKKQIAYITNSNEGGIVVVDLVSGQVRQVLHAANVTKADTNYTVHRNGVVLQRENKSFHVQSDGVALSYDGSQLYFKSLTDDWLYRVATKDLNNTSLSEDALEHKVATLGRFTTTDGMTIDADNNLYLGDLEKRRLVRITPSLKMTDVVAPNEALAWPDSYHLTKDGWLYISCSRIDEQPAFHNGVNQRKGPYRIYKLKIKSQPTNKGGWMLGI